MFAGASGATLSCVRSPCLLWLALFLLVLPRPHPAGALRGPSPWLTLSGNAPVVIARGGLSGLLPDSGGSAYALAQDISLPDVVLWCDVQLTKDEVGICLSDVNMDWYTNSAVIFHGAKQYVLDGVSVSGHFPLDYKFDDLSQVFLRQNVSSRIEKFDGWEPIVSVNELESHLKNPRLWLNIQRNMFYSQHNMSMRSYILSVTRQIPIDYVSSPEVSFLKSMPRWFKKSNTKLIFRFLGVDIAEASTNQTYGSLLRNLTFIKTFASGILVPKGYIWPVNEHNYLQNYTSLVLDAHRAGLEVFVAGFVNDDAIPYNYSYDPIAEYLSFVDNGAFSVDGVLTDFSVTASAAIGCYSHSNGTTAATANFYVISHNGASGVYPGCTDLAYKQAIDDGADYIDCPVQVTKDGTLICLNSVDLASCTTAITSSFNSHFSIIPEIQSDHGIFSFNLTWQEIKKSLKPEISNPQLKYQLLRNPLYRNAGNFMTLTDFLVLAKDKAISGVLIAIEHAAFLAAHMSFSITDAVLKALDNAGYNQQTRLDVIIQSRDSSVLMKMRQKTNYKLMYVIDKLIRDASSSSIKDITQFAHSVAIHKESIYPESAGFIVAKTDIASKFKAANLSVFAYVFANEFTSQPWDFYSDATMEIKEYFEKARVDGIITDFPRTATTYRRNTCLNLGSKTPAYMLPVDPAALMALLPPQAMPPTISPMPILSVADVVEPPLPPASPNMLNYLGANSSPSPVTPSGQPSYSVSLHMSLLLTVGSFLLIW